MHLKQCAELFLKLFGGKLQNLLGMKLTTSVNLLLLSAVDNDIFIFFLSQVLTMKLTESMNICYISDRVACTIKRNIKEISWKTIVLLELSEWRTNSCCSITTLGNPWAHVKQSWYYKVWQPIMNSLELVAH